MLWKMNFFANLVYVLYTPWIISLIGLIQSLSNSGSRLANGAVNT